MVATLQVWRIHVGAAVPAGQCGPSCGSARVHGATVGQRQRTHVCAARTMDNELLSHCDGAVLPAAAEEGRTHPAALQISLA